MKQYIYMNLIVENLYGGLHFEVGHIQDQTTFHGMSHIGLVPKILCSNMSHGQLTSTLPRIINSDIF